MVAEGNDDGVWILLHNCLDRPLEIVGPDPGQNLDHRGPERAHGLWITVRVGRGHGVKRISVVVDRQPGLSGSSSYPDPLLYQARRQAIEAEKILVDALPDWLPAENVEESFRQKLALGESELRIGVINKPVVQSKKRRIVNELNFVAAVRKGAEGGVPCIEDNPLPHLSLRDSPTELQNPGEVFHRHGICRIGLIQNSKAAGPQIVDMRKIFNAIKFSKCLRGM